MAVQIQMRRDSAANWTLYNPILAGGEWGLEVDTNRMKIGDGATAWVALPYEISGGGGGGGGSVATVTAGNANITIGGTAQNVTVAVSPGYFDPIGSASAGSVGAETYAFGLTQAASIGAIAASEAYADTSAHNASVAAAGASDPRGYASAASTAAIASAFLTTQAASVALASEIPAPVVNAVEGLSGSVTFYSPNSSVNITTSGASVGFTAIGGSGGSVSSVFGRIGVVTAQSGDYATFYDQLGDAAAASIAAIAVSEAYADIAAHNASVAAVSTSEAYADNAAHNASVTAVSTAEAYADISAHNASVAAVNSAFLTTQSASTAAVAASDPSGTAASVKSLALLSANNLSDVPTKGSGRYNLRIPALAAVQAAATASVNVASAPSSVDGYSFISSGLDTVLLTAQTSASANGPWVWNGASVAMTRPSDWPTGGNVTTGRLVAVQNGTLNAGTIWTIAVPSSGITIDTTAQTWNSLNILGTLNNESVIRANTLNQMGAPTAAVSMGGSVTPQRLTTMHQGINATDAANITQLSSGRYPFVVSGCVWTADDAGASVTASMTAGTVEIGGVLLTVASVGSRSFATSSDTYVDLRDNTDGTATIAYNVVTNNSLSPALTNGGTIYNTLRVAIITVGASNIAAAGNIGQGAVNGVSLGVVAGATTVAAGSNNFPITAASVNVAAGSNLASGGGWIKVAHGSTTTATNYVIQYTSITSNVLNGATVISGSGSVATGDTVTQVFPVGLTDMLGNLIYNTRPFPTLIGYIPIGTTFSTQNTSIVPVPGLIAPFVVPSGPQRQLKLTFVTPYLKSSAAAGSNVNIKMFVGNSISGGTTANIAGWQFDVSLTNDGTAATIIAIMPTQIAAGSYTVQVAATQSASGTMVVGLAYSVTTMQVELV